MCDWGAALLTQLVHEFIKYEYSVFSNTLLNIHVITHI